MVCETDTDRIQRNAVYESSGTSQSNVGRNRLYVRMSAFTEDCIPRSVSRGMFNVVGCLLFIVLYLILPKSMYPYIGMIGGIGVGYSAGYPWQTAFNTFGALSIAAGIFGMPAAIALRIGANVLGAAYTVICNKVTDKVAEYIGTNKCAENLS